MKSNRNPVRQFLAKVRSYFVVDADDTRTLTEICNLRINMAVAAEGLLLEFLSVIAVSALLFVIGLEIYGIHLAWSSLLAVAIALIAAYVSVFWGYVSYTTVYCDPVEVSRDRSQRVRALSR